MTSLSPNADRKQIRLVLRMLFNPLLWAKWKKGEHIASLENELAQYIGHAHSVSFNSGRTALFFALQALGVSEGDEVIVQGYTCISVPNAVVLSGARPVYVDVGEDLNMDIESLKKRITPKTKVIITQNTFGVPADIYAIQKIAEKNNIKIIEDCAHALGAKIEDRRIGSFGDISIFSFGRDKVISSISGGAATTDNAAIHQKLLDARNGLSDMSYTEIKRHLLHPIIMSIVRSTYSFMHLGKVVFHIARLLRLTPKVLTQEEKCGVVPQHTMKRLPNALAWLAHEQLENIEIRNQSRREKAKYYTQKLPQDVLGHQEFPVEGYSIFLRYTIFTEKTEKLRFFARQRGVYLGDWYDTVIAPKDADRARVNYQEGVCPNAERLAKLSVNLPNHFRITRADQDRIISLLTDFYQK